MDAALTRDTLARLLAEENTALTEFAVLLDKEHVALRGRDIDALETLANFRKQQLTPFQYAWAPGASVASWRPSLKKRPA